MQISCWVDGARFGSQKHSGAAAAAAVYDWPLPTTVNLEDAKSVSLETATSTKRYMDCKWLGAATNNVAELEAVNVALNMLPSLNLDAASASTPHRITIVSDSTYACDVLSGKSMARTNVKYVDSIRDRLSTLYMNHIRVELLHRPRMHALNKAADELSKTCILRNADLNSLTHTNRRKAERLRGLTLTKRPPRIKRMSVSDQLCGFEMGIRYKRWRRASIIACII